ncbi:hypothetical protein PICMEDRAFT_58798 [Pichia membranifaciens NRRL Y-2026]|uniref:VPS9 domain-containing protein n=1 Tax=Pichia membranifaciens NRRL Y-2026 TaxID=763406 RepID=A0A1E3NLQ9_9ASCO|nr:hypothetical protein PICMEDRAFT_58798 [Pichia membranifaciens NRRL Y-2026]ODQ46508.1 hypothetical protein PICMEDRAFT_58798 [Pichia membranifaciens NRRL Y-2026]
MFHTPPVKSDWQPEASIANSYDVGNVDSNSNYSDNDSQPATLDTDDAKDILQHSPLEIGDDVLSKVTPNIAVKNGNGGGKGLDSNSNSATTATITRKSADRESTHTVTPMHLAPNPVDPLRSPALDFQNDLPTSTDAIAAVAAGSTGIPDQTVSDNSSFIESFDIVTEADLPMQLVKLYESFLKELKEPKFERSLASFEIAELFQTFYQRFHVGCTQYIEQEGKYELHDPHHTDIGYQYYRYNLILERILCDKFYSQIIFPLKNMEIDEYEKEFNDQFCDKLGCLSSLDIHFQNLDIDLPENIEAEFINHLDDRILPEFELLTAERSPTLKMKYLIRIHKKIGEIIHDITKSSKFSKTLNTDIYLPILIFTIIKLKELRAYFLVRQLNLMKRFSNEYIFENSVESFQIEKGKLLYVCANFEAAISYLSSVTLDNLDMPLPSEDINLLPGSLKDRDELLNLLTVPLKLESIEDEVSAFKESNPLLMTSSLKNDASIGSPTLTTSLSNITNSWVDYSKVSLPSVINADQGLKSISQAIDSSLKNIMGKVSRIGGSSDDIMRYVGSNEITNDGHDVNYDITYEDYDENTTQHGNDTNTHTEAGSASATDDGTDNTLSDSLLRQLEENLVFEQTVGGGSIRTIKGSEHSQDTEVTCPTTALPPVGDPAENSHRKIPSIQEETPFPDQYGELASSSIVGGPSSFTSYTKSALREVRDRTESTVSVGTQGTQEGSIISKLTTSVGGVMKNFRPVSASSSTTSLNMHLTDGGMAATTTATSTAAAAAHPAASGLERSTSVGYLATTPNKNAARPSTVNMRSRATSFMSTSLFGSPSNQSFVNEANNSTTALNTSAVANTSVPGLTPSSPSRDYRNSIFSSLESAFDNVRNRSRDNSLVQGPAAPLSSTTAVPDGAPALTPTSSAPVPPSAGHTRLLDEVAKFKRFDKPFEQMTVTDLIEMYTNYQYILSRL